MKQCPVCRTPYDQSLSFCTKDGTPLPDGPPSGFDTQPTTLKLQAQQSKDGGRIRTLLTMEIEDNLSALGKYQSQAKDRGKDFNKSPIGHAMVLDGYRYNALPTPKREIWLSLLPSLPNSDLTADELRQIQTFYKQLDNLESIKGSTNAAKRKMDNERHMEELIFTLIQNGNPLAL